MLTRLLVYGAQLFASAILGVIIVTALALVFQFGADEETIFLVWAGSTVAVFLAIVARTQRPRQ